LRYDVVHMRFSALAFIGLVGCGEVTGVVPDAPPEVPIDAAIDAPPDAPVPVPRLYALTRGGSGLGGLEVIDLRTTTKIAFHDLPAGAPSSLAVSPDGTTAYIGDTAAAVIRVIDTRTGMPQASISLASVYDLVLSADGALLFATAGDKIVRIELATGTQTPSPMIGTAGYAAGISLAPSGARLAVTAGSDVGLVRTSDMSIEATLRLTTSGTSNCGVQPFATAFKGNDRVLVWDNNCDELFQIDPGTQAQLTASTVVTGRDSGSGGEQTSRLAVTAASNLAFALREDETLSVMNTETKTFLNVGGFGGFPGALGSSVSGDRMFITEIPLAGGPNKLAVYDTANSQLTSGAYTFTPPTQTVVDTAMNVAP